ncbi:tRNA (N(6)-L-threonylcarbamoyladenosine(37)-C(2))-methylthiotransferase MtaB [Roseixanthobacter liquoris]|uniref:tRNA (N(6)-L-threonylcarbamoyladenosine(37)-C(2))- methylthiotransferase MtaB n=1 Tax=Roseixanthobacter liquoris TaxID=3119921 RepID=UPI00372985B4
MSAAPVQARGVEVVTFGCRLNTLDSEQMRRAAEASGLERTFIVNSCAVTAEAVRQARQTIRRLKRAHPDMRVVVTGCAAQTEPETFAAMAEVDRVIGNGAKGAPETWAAARAALDLGRAAEEKVVVDDIMSVRETALHMVDGLDRHTRAFVQVQNGCDHRCTFCIIPYGRGNSRSVPMGEVVAQVRTLVETGHGEVVLTGVDLTSYGAGLPGAPTLGKLVRAILKHVPELKRLRLSSIDTVEADADLLRALAEEERLMPHLHLSLQSGDDLILKRMKRRHSRAEAIRLVGEMRRLRPDLVFGADLIAGFPTEEEAQFRNTLDIVEACGLSFLHVFPYSPRPGTPAARMPQVPHEVVKARARRLREAGATALHRHLSLCVGAQRSVLMESGGLGRTEHFTPVRVSRPAPRGTILPLRIAGHDGARLIAA